MQVEEIDAVFSRVTTVAPSGAVGKIILIFSAEGAGKTTLATQGPKPLLVEIKDKSSDVLKESGFLPKDLPVVRTSGWLDSLEVLAAIADKPHSYKTIVVDGASGASEWCDDYITEQDFDNSKAKFAAFGAGDKVAGREWSNLMSILDRMKERGLMVFLLAHQGTQTVRNPSGDDYLKAVPHMSSIKLAATGKYTDAILFIDYILLQKDVNKQTHVGKAVGGEERVMRTSPSAAYAAKNRMGLPDPIMLGDSQESAFRAFREAIQAGKKYRSGEVK